MRRSFRLWAVLPLTVLLLVFGAAPAFGWANGDNAGNGYGTHDWVITEAKRLAGANGSGWLDLGVALLASDDPDTVLHDTYHHVYDVWGDWYGDAPDHIAWVYASIASARDVGNYTEASRLFGLLAHYYADICNPLHTDSDPLESSMHSSYEDWVERRTDAVGENRSWIVPDGLGEVTDIHHGAVDAATRAHLDYWALLEAWVASDLATRETITVRALDRAANDLADILEALEGPGIFRTLRGADRYETATLISGASYPDGSPTAFVVKGDDFPDALCAAPLARVLDGPILLTPSTSLSSRTAAELVRLDPKEVYVIGLSDTVAQAVGRALGVDPILIRGVDRYDTARLVAEHLLRELGSRPQVVVAPGDSFPDALAAAPLAAARGWPILLTPQFGTSTPVATLAALADLGATEALVVGTYNDPPGVGVVSKVGTDRYDTCGLIADYAVAQGMSYAHVGFATGQKFPDALAAGPYLAKDEGLLLLVGPISVPQVIGSRVQLHGADVQKAYFIGLADGVIDQVKGMLP